MNKRYISLFIALALSLTPYATHTNPRSQVIVVDMDDVFVDAYEWSIKAHVYANIASTLPHLGWKMLTNGRFRKNVKQIFKDHKQDNILVALARVHKPLRKKVDSLLRAIHSKRTLIPDVIELFKALKDRGYTIIVATNRQRIGFEITAKVLNFDQLYNGQRLFDAVITGGTNIIPTLATINGKRFSRLTTDPLLDDYITVANAEKPDKSYYQVVRTVVDNYVTAHQEQFDISSPEIIFFDDKKKNIDGANTSDLNISAYQVPDRKKGASMRRNVENHLGISFA